MSLTIKIIKDWFICQTNKEYKICQIKNCVVLLFNRRTFNKRKKSKFNLENEFNEKLEAIIKETKV